MDRNGSKQFELLNLELDGPCDHLVLVIRASDSWGSKVGETTCTQVASLAHSLECAWHRSPLQGLSSSLDFWKAPWGQRPLRHCLPHAGNERKLQKKVCRSDRAVAGTHHPCSSRHATVFASQHRGLFQPHFRAFLPLAVGRKGQVLYLRLASQRQFLLMMPLGGKLI